MDQEILEPHITPWRKLYAVLAATDVDHIATYEVLSAALKMDDSPESRRFIQQTIPHARKRLLETTNRAVENVPREGYRIVTSAEHLRLARGHQRDADRQLVRSLKTLVHVNVSELTPEERKRFDAAGQAVATVVDMNRRLDIRRDRLDKATEAAHMAMPRTPEQTAELRDRLAEIERKRAERS